MCNISPSLYLSTIGLVVESHRDIRSGDKGEI